MTQKQLLGGAIGICTILGLSGTWVQADPWYRERGLASHYGK